MEMFDPHQKTRCPGRVADNLDLLDMDSSVLAGKRVKVSVCLNTQSICDRMNRNTVGFVQKMWNNRPPHPCDMVRLPMEERPDV